MAQLNKEKWAYWLRLSMEGDKNTYRLLLCELRIWLEAYFKKRVHNFDAEDLVQETLLTIHNKRQTFDPSREFIPWLAAVARNKWIDRLRKNLKYFEQSLDDDIIDENTQELCAKHDVENLLKLISPNQAQILKLLKLNEMSIQEVAEHTGHTQANVKIIAHRGLKELQLKIREVEND